MKKIISMLMLITLILLVFSISASATTQPTTRTSYSEITYFIAERFIGNLVDSNGCGGSVYASYSHATYHEFLWTGYWTGNASATTEYRRADGAMGGISVSATVKNQNEGLSDGPNTNDEGSSVGWISTESEISSHYATYLYFYASGYGMSVSYCP